MSKNVICSFNFWTFYNKKKVENIVIYQHLIMYTYYLMYSKIWKRLRFTCNVYCVINIEDWVTLTVLHSLLSPRRVFKFFFLWGSGWLFLACAISAAWHRFWTKMAPLLFKGLANMIFVVAVVDSVSHMKYTGHSYPTLLDFVCSKCIYYYASI